MSVKLHPIKCNVPTCSIQCVPKNELQPEIGGYLCGTCTPNRCYLWCPTCLQHEYHKERPQFSCIALCEVLCFSWDIMWIRVWQAAVLCERLQLICRINTSETNKRTRLVINKCSVLTVQVQLCRRSEVCKSPCHQPKSSLCYVIQILRNDQLNITICCFSLISKLSTYCEPWLIWPQKIPPQIPPVSTILHYDHKFREWPWS